MLYHYYHFKFLQSLKTTNIQEWEFYIWAVRIIYSIEFDETFEFFVIILWDCKLVKSQSKRASEVAIFIF